MGQTAKAATEIVKYATASNVTRAVGMLSVLSEKLSSLGPDSSQKVSQAMSDGRLALLASDS